MFEQNQTQTAPRAQMSYSHSPCVTAQAECQEPEITRELCGLEKTVDYLYEAQNKLHDKLRPVLATTPQEGHKAIGRVAAPVNTELGGRISLLSERVFAMEQFILALIAITEL